MIDGRYPLILGLFSNVFAIIATLLLPLGAGLWLGLKRKGYVEPLLLGAATFFVFQIVIRIPILQLVLGEMTWYSIFSMTQPVLYALFLGATAALFEEGGRWIVMRAFMKKKRSIKDGIAFGIGHGGIEAVLLVGINAVALLIIYGPSTTPLLTALGGAERIFIMILHVSWSVMVLKSVVLHKPMWLVLAFVLHTVIDMAAVLMQQSGVSVYISEGFIALAAILSLWYIIVAYKKYRGADIQ